MNVYLSHSRECTNPKKEHLFDYINESYAMVEPKAFWGGNYDRQERMDDADFVLICSWDHSSDWQQASRGIFKEACYAIKELKIPVYAVISACVKGISPLVEVKEIKSVMVKDPDAYSGTHGMFQLGKKVYYLNDLLKAHLDGMFQDKVKKTPETEIVSPRRLFTGAKLLNLI